MSIKIWEAYRVKRGYDYWDVLQDIRARAQANAKNELRKVFAALKEAWQKDPKLYGDSLREADFKYTPENISNTVVADYVYSMYKKQMSTSLKNEWDLSASVTVRRVGKQFLLIPYKPSGYLHKVMDFMKKMKSIEDFHYQNQSDPPYAYGRSKVTPQMWAHRRRTWDKVLDEPKWSEILILEIISPDLYSAVNPVWDDTMKQFLESDRKRKKKIKST